MFKRKKKKGLQRDPGYFFHFHLRNPVFILPKRYAQIQSFAFVHLLFFFSLYIFYWFQALIKKMLCLWETFLPFLVF